MCDHEAIIYLSSLGPGLRGGETVFPVALDPQKEGPPSEAEERMIEAAGELLDVSLDHTDKVLDETRLDIVDAARIKQAARDLLFHADHGSTGLRVTPSQGSACLFWTRQDDGEIDRFSWHGGAPVVPDADTAQRLKPEMQGWKWTLQKFKEVPVDVRSNASKMADFVRRTRREAFDKFG
ncbi:MSBP2 [Symbiodinium pilosum]|uniref:MSBP2 protein n=1 Tax=Symbiodinium pilosum TaxID=2952 RepID=A0A812W4I8_SYMPI|nr:MSBP2 [Symbiodinium pilosum]